ncbi:MAG: hypothetical protein J6V17_02240 [Bacteroidales bacterium]|nr:hypothetical protein [Bacteroidales bacterium]
MSMKYIISVVGLILMTAATSFGQTEEVETIVLGKEIMQKDTTKERRFKNHLIAPKGEWQCGLSVMYADFSSDDTEYMLMLQGVNAKASMMKLAPEAAYTFKENHAVGARFQYTNINGMLDTATADLLGNLSMTLGNVTANSRAMSGSIFQRTYVGLDNYGRIGLFWDYALGYTRNTTQFYTGDTSSSYSVKNKVHLGFSPGIVYFPMNNVSVQASLCFAELSYNNVAAYADGQKTGSRNAWKAQASLNIMDLYFGLTIHF